MIYFLSVLRLIFNQINLFSIAKAGFNLVKTSCKPYTAQCSPSRVFNIEVNLNNSALQLPSNVCKYIEEKAKLCEPDKIHLCDGSEEENAALLRILEASGSVKRLENNKLAINLYLLFITRQQWN